MRIVIIPSDYPDSKRNVYSFVKQLVDEFARQGHACIVISPVPVSQFRNRQYYKETYIVGAGMVTVLRPLFFSMSRFSQTHYFRQRAVARTIKRIKRPDIVYGHFWKNGFDAFPVSQKMNIPLFVATGESDIKNQFEASDEYNCFYNYVSGVICVSTKNMHESIALNITEAQKCIVLPNAINQNVFHLMDKIKCREQLGIDDNSFVVAFVGWFNERKGSKRVAEAIKLTQGKAVYSFFLGEGEDVPDCPNILHMGKIKHEILPIYLNAADCFVLPTQKEGCCNAIIEAMACGLPIISSNRDFNKDVLNEANSILIEPNDVDGLAKAIMRLRDNSELRESMSKAALDTAKSLSIEQRAERIIEFIKSKMA